MGSKLVAYGVITIAASVASLFLYAMGEEEGLN